ncbi:MAG TPA: hypothetical protein VGF17_00345 [Phytomonospora sp.]
MPASNALRLLFLVAVILGLGWMHTIGSPGHHDAGMVASHVAAAHDADMGAIASSSPTADNGPATAMCLAILAAAVALAALLTVRVRRGGAGPSDDHRTAAGHGPPRLIPPGLLIADSTVLRI